MAKSNIVVQFICYSPRIYSGFDKYNLVLARTLKRAGYNSVFVFSDDISVRPIIDDLMAENVIIELISTRNKIVTLRDVLRLFYKYKPFIVHTHFENFIQLVTAFLSLLFNSRYFISFHSTISLSTISEYRKNKGLIKFVFLRLYYRFLIVTSNNVICVSNAIKDQFRAFSGSDSSKICSLHLGVKIFPRSNSKKELRTFLSLPVDEVLMVNVSAIEHIKGLDILIKTVYILKYQYHLDNFKCFHIGGSRKETIENVLYKEELYRKVKDLHLDNIFIWLGHRNDIEEILSAFDIYVQPSRMEGIPVAIMEACTNSLPVVGTRIGGIPEIIFQNINGFLFLSESAEEMANYLKLLINEKEMRNRMGSESYRIVNENYNFEKQTRMLVDLYLSDVNDRIPNTDL